MAWEFSQACQKIAVDQDLPQKQCLANFHKHHTKSISHLIKIDNKNLRYVLQIRNRRELQFQDNYCTESLHY